MPKQRERVARKCYIYRIFDGFETLYIGKGTGRRLAIQIKRFGAQGEIIEKDLTDSAAFERERYWIAKLMPTMNKNGGGAGSYTKNNKPIVPRALRNLVSETKWRKALQQVEAEQAEIEAVGTRRYVARFLLSKLNEDNCELYGLSKVGVNRLREVADGPRC